MQWLGYELGEDRNCHSTKPGLSDTLISTPTSRVPLYVLATNEEVMISLQTKRMAFATGDTQDAETVF